MAGWRGFAPAMGGPKAVDLVRAGIGAGLGLLLAGLALQGLGIGWLIAVPGCGIFGSVTFISADAFTGEIVAVDQANGEEDSDDECGVAAWGAPLMTGCG